MSEAETKPAQRDALEQTDAWRGVWQIVTSNAAFALVFALALLVMMALAALPQIPAGGTASAAAYSQWQAKAREISSAAFPAWDALGLFNIAQSLWARLVFALLLAMGFARALSAIFELRAVRARQPGLPALQDEVRLRVTDAAPPIPQLAAALRGLRHRTQDDGEAWLIADRLPITAIFSLALNAGAALFAAGMLMNLALGWVSPRMLVNENTPATLPNGTQLRFDEIPHALTPNAPALAWLAQPPFGVHVLQLNAEVRLTAQDAAGRPLSITESSYASPAQSALVSLTGDTPERLLGIEGANMAAQILPAGDGRARVFEVPSGKILADAALAPSLQVNDVTLKFERIPGAVIEAHNLPGMPFVQAGLALAALGFIAALAYPARRILIHQHDGWTEFYGRGRGVGQVARKL
ncbi:MAG TPA: hypothetical protein PLJ62_10850 [Thermoflexales bacterium]|nr:hypothetical protein [Thermoflexales bacterium]HRA00689.1 hypothetical protein [Thermoflexales bacterium]